MKQIVSFLVLLAALGCRTSEIRPTQGAARVSPTLAPGAKIRSDADAKTAADLSAASCLTLRSTGNDGMISGQSDANPTRHENPTRTVLEVERGCVIVSVNDLPANSVFSIRSGDVVAHVQGAAFSLAPDGNVAFGSGQVTITAGDKSAVLREEALIENDPPESSDASDAVTGDLPRRPAPNWTASLSPYERGLADIHHWY